MFHITPQEFLTIDSVISKANECEVTELGRNTEFLGDRVLALKDGLWSKSCNLIITTPKAGASAFQVPEQKKMLRAL